jgi:hypothetical protein
VHAFDATEDLDAIAVLPSRRCRDEQIACGSLLPSAVNGRSNGPTTAGPKVALTVSRGKH